MKILAHISALFLFPGLLLISQLCEAQTATSFTNPIVTSRDAADPWMIYKDGYYYFTATTGVNIYVWKSRTITGIDAGTKTTVWTPPATGPQSRDIWAPELHFLNGKWYIYFAADDGDNAHHRLYVLESATGDPQGAYNNKGKIYDPNADRWAIDATVMQKEDGTPYLVWSGWEGFVDHVAQNLYIAPMSNPWTIGGNRVLISRPDRLWEGWINEGPEVLKRDGKIFIIYSANGSWTPDYCLSMLMNTNGDVLNPSAWTKSNAPVLSRAPRVYGPGHNTFVKSPDGSEDWIIYHANDAPTDGWNNRRPRAQKFTWNADGTPNFGYPIAPGTALAVPSGESSAAQLPGGKGTGLTGEYYDNEDFTDLKLRRTDATINYEWGIIGITNAPVPALGNDTYSIRWRGQIQPRYSETYTFNTFSDDGVRLWIDNKLLIDDWANHPPTVDAGTISLAGGRRYDIRVDYHQHTDEAVVRLEWLSQSQPLEVIPSTQLYPLTDATPLAISLNAPADGATYITPAQVILSATVAGSDSTIKSVEFFANAVKLGEASDAAPTLTWNIVAAGDYQLSARATDEANNTVSSIPLGITVTAASVSRPHLTRALPLRDEPGAFLARLPAGGMARAYVELPGAGLTQASSAPDAAGKWPLNLGGIEVGIGQSAATPLCVVPLNDAGAYAIDFAVPDEVVVTAGTIVAVRRADSQQTWSDQVEVVMSYPALWTVDGATSGQALSQGADTLLAISDAYPAIADARMRIALYCTGVRGLAAAQNLVVHGRVGVRDMVLPVDYAGPEKSLPGLDLIIVRLPESFAGSAEVALSINDETTSQVFLPVQ